MNRLACLSDRARMLLVLVPVLAANALIGIDIHRLSARRETIKQDYSQVNSIRYGLLSVDAWKDRIRTIVGDKIGDFKLTKEHEALLREEITDALNAMISEADRLLAKHQNSFSGKIGRAHV